MNSNLSNGVIAKFHNNIKLKTLKTSQSKIAFSCSVLFNPFIPELLISPKLKKETVKKNKSQKLTTQYQQQENLDVKLSPCGST
jgi:hypothetical protein